MVNDLFRSGFNSDGEYMGDKKLEDYLYYEEKNPDLKIYCGDCLEILPLLPKVDLVVTDPPYAVLDETWDRFKEKDFLAFSARWILWVRENAKELFTFSATTRDEIPTICRMVYNNVRRLVWDKGSAATGEGKFWFVYEDIYKCDNNQPIDFVERKYLRFARVLTKRREQSGLSKGAVDILVRGKKTGLCYRWEEGCCLPNNEQIEILKGVLKLDKQDIDVLQEEKYQRDTVLSEMRGYASENGAALADVLRFPVAKQTDHVCEKPLKLIKTLIEVGNGEYVFDPFLGSGTTLVACKELNRNGIGIEISEKYCEIAKKRLQNTSRSLFTEVEKPKEEKTLF